MKPRIVFNLDETLVSAKTKIEISTAISLAGLIWLYSIIVYDGEERLYRFWYYIPSAPCIATWVLDRIWRRKQLSKCMIFVDSVVVVLCLARPLWSIPGFSGHALFSAYAILSCRRMLARITAFLLLLETIFVKIFIWHHDKTLYGGLLLALICFMVLATLANKEPR